MPGKAYPHHAEGKNFNRRGRNKGETWRGKISCDEDQKDNTLKVVKKEIPSPRRGEG
jgi:hypothetical protein